MSAVHRCDSPDCNVLVGGSGFDLCVACKAESDRVLAELSEPPTGPKPAPPTCAVRTHSGSCLKADGHKGAHDPFVGHGTEPTTPKPRPDTTKRQRADPDVCTSPPPGWLCTKGAGHPGPCAANTVVLCKAVDGYGRACSLPAGHPPPHVQWDLTGANPRATELQLDPDIEKAAGKTDVVMLELVDLEFVTDMALQLTAGLKRPGRQPNGWQDLDPRKWRDKCAGAALRHMTAARRGFGEIDPETGATHWGAVAVNAMMCWWFERLITGAKRADNEEEQAK